MLPDIPKTKQQILMSAQLYTYDKTRELWPLLKLIHSVTQHEGQVHSYEQVGGKIVSQGYHEMAAPIEVRFDEVPELVGDRLTNKLDPVADEMARQQSAMFYGKLHEITSEAGMTVNADGKPLSQDLFLELMERRDIDFDEHGRPQNLFVGSPQMCDLFARSLAQWDEDPTFRTRHDEILQRKREAWRDRESNRKLVS